MGKYLDEFHRPVPMEGEHTTAILGECLGLESVQIDQLLAAAVVRQWNPPLRTR